MSSSKTGRDHAARIPTLPPTQKQVCDSTAPRVIQRRRCRQAPSLLGRTPIDVLAVEAGQCHPLPRAAPAVKGSTTVSYPGTLTSAAPDKFCCFAPAKVN